MPSQAACQWGPVQEGRVPAVRGEAFWLGGHWGWRGQVWVRHHWNSGTRSPVVLQRQRALCELVLIMLLCTLKLWIFYTNRCCFFVCLLFMCGTCIFLEWTKEVLDLLIWASLLFPVSVCGDNSSMCFWTKYLFVSFSSSFFGGWWQEQICLVTGTKRTRRKQVESPIWRWLYVADSLWIILCAHWITLCVHWIILCAHSVCVCLDFESLNNTLYTLSLHLSVCLSVGLSSVSLSVCLCLCLCLPVSVCLSVCLRSTDDGQDCLWIFF